MAEQKQDDQLEHTYSSYVGIRDVALKTCQRRWTIGISGESGSGISVLAARHDDDDDDFKQFTLTYVLSFNEVRSLNVKRVPFQAIQFSITTQFSSIWPIDWTLISWYHSESGRTWEQWQWSGLCILQSSGITIRLLSVISMTQVWWVLSLCRYAVSVFY